jgi:hypothetical protein
MNRFVAKTFLLGGVCAAILSAPAGKPVAAQVTAQSTAQSDDQAVLQSDHSFVVAVGKSDKAALGKLLDADFTWTDSAGSTLTRAEILQNLPTPASGYDAEPKARTYGQVGAVQAASGKVHVLRVWVRRSKGWRALVYQEVTQAEKAATPGPSTNDCENPCKTVPYKTKNAAEKGIILSWQQLETAVTNHDPKEWQLHFADEFVLIASGGTQPTTKAGRIEQLSKPGIGPAPPGLASGRMFDFGDTIVMVSQTLPYSGKPAHITRVWFKADPTWMMALSYQTTIQSAPAVVPQ